MPTEIRSWRELETFLSQNPESLSVLDCYATWCGPCKSIAPFYQELSERYTDVFFLKADVEKIKELSTEFEVSSMPTFIFLKNLTALDKLEGADQKKLIRYIERYR